MGTIEKISVKFILKLCMEVSIKVKDFRKKVKKFKDLIKLNTNYKRLNKKCFSDLIVITPDDFGEKIIIEKIKRNIKLSKVHKNKHYNKQKIRTIKLKFVKNIKKIFWW